MTLASQVLIDNISLYRFNPAGIQRTVVQALSEINNGEQQLFDATSPFVQSLSASAYETAAFMQQHAAESRRRYPSLSQTQEDLYLHMSDEDYINRFSIPATAKFSLRFNKNELINAMRYEDETGYMKLVIPRNTFFTADVYSFSLQYPIEIRQLSHGGLQITYNNDIASPLQVLESNTIDYEILEDGNYDQYVKFDVPTTQFSIVQSNAPISKAKDLIMTMEIADQFYYARVYHKNTRTGKWDELLTTHAESVYDVKKPTAVLRVLNSFLTIKIPQIYVTTGQLNSTIRVDLYQSKGQINLPLVDYRGDAVSITWKTFDSTEINNKYSAALPNMNVAAYSDETVIGGKNEMALDTLRTNVINNATGPIRQAITPAQLETQIRNAGYDVVKNVDNVTNRVYLATREMPSPELVKATNATSTANKLLTAAAASIETLTIATEALARLSTVRDNGESLTITPNTLYQIIDGITSPVAESEVQRLLALPPDKRALEVTSGNYLFTPFHYVVDTSNNAFEIRPYYLDDPVAESKVFVKQNDTTMVLVGTASYALVRSNNGYTLRVVTRSDETYKVIPDNQVFAQLAYVPFGERDRAYLNGTMVGKTEAGERVFDFDLATNFNVDANDNLDLTKFTMYNPEARITKTSLLNSFDLVYSTSAVLSSRWMPNEVDHYLGRHLLPNQISGINHERIKLKFGEALEMLWTRARSVVSSIVYEAWEEDQQAFYKEDVHQYNADGTKLSIVDGQLQYTVLHHAGAPILDGNGEITYEHRKGDLKRDSNNELVQANPRGMLRQIDLMLIEGVYWFATDTTTATYRTALTNALVKWIASDLEPFKGTLADKTRIYFYPKTTSGMIGVYILDEVRTNIPAGQAFAVTLGVSKQVHDNSNLKARIEETTVAVLSETLKQKTVSISEVLDKLREAYGSDVIDVQITGLGGIENYSVVTVAEDTDRLSIRKRLVAMADGTLAAEEDVTCTFRKVIARQ
jgi:hypothetical protein